MFLTNVFVSFCCLLQLLTNYSLHVAVNMHCNCTQMAAFVYCTALQLGKERVWKIFHCCKCATQQLNCPLSHLYTRMIELHMRIIHATVRLTIHWYNTRHVAFNGLKWYRHEITPSHNSNTPHSSISRLLLNVCLLKSETETRKYQDPRL